MALNFILINSADFILLQVLTYNNIIMAYYFVSSMEKIVVIFCFVNISARAYLYRTTRHFLWDSGMAKTVFIYGWHWLSFYPQISSYVDEHHLAVCDFLSILHIPMWGGQKLEVRVFCSCPLAAGCAGWVICDLMSVSLIPNSWYACRRHESSWGS